MTTLDTLRALIAKRFRSGEEKCTPDATLDSLGIDSLAVVDLLFEVEDLLKIRVPYEQINITTLQELADYIDELIAEQCGSVDQAKRPP